MKKKIFLISVISILLISGLFFLTGCGNNKKEEKTLTSSENKDEKTVEYLFEQFIKVYTKADVDTLKEIFPPFYVEYAKNYMTKEYLENSLNKEKERYGDDFNITYEITKKTQLTDEELEKINKSMSNYFKTDSKTFEGYKLEGYLIYKGSKKEAKQSLSSFYYCKYDEGWFLVRK